jgi:hypothetical protein
MTKPVADLDVFMGNRWANMGSFMGNLFTPRILTAILKALFLVI